jgi:indolepyruvate ferredoxin oxidoreductase
MWSALKILAPLKSLRGTPFDPFGYLAERKEERQLIRDFENTLKEIVSALTPENYATATELASLPLQIRGYGHVKSRAIKDVKSEEKKLLEAFRKSGEVST